MKLLGVEKRGDWLYSEWALTYRVGWGQIRSAAALIWQYTTDPEILTGDSNGEKTVDIENADEVAGIAECGYLTIRGVSDMIRVPLSITFYNQTDFVRASVACATEEFMEADYKKFNLSMCQFMDSVELAMY